MIKHVVVSKPIGEVQPSSRNARKHTDEQVQQIAASIEQWGWTFPLLIDGKGEIICGEGRWLAAKRLRLKTVPCLVADSWTEQQVVAYRIADNQLTINSHWDFDRLLEEFSALQKAEFDLSLLGFDADFVKNMLEELQQVDPVEEWDGSGMPEFEMDDSAEPFCRVSVCFRNEADLKAFSELIGQPLTPRTKTIWHPEMPEEGRMEKAWVSEG